MASTNVSDYSVDEIFPFEDEFYRLIDAINDFDDAIRNSSSLSNYDFNPIDNGQCITLELFARLSNSSTTDEPSLLDKTATRLIFGLLYSLICVGAVVSNGLVIAVIFTTFILGRRRRYRTSASNEASLRRRRDESRIFFDSNAATTTGGGPFCVQTIFVLSLACSDLAAAFSSLPVTAITIFSGEWLFPRFMCKSISFVQAASTFQSSFTYTSIAIDRCVSVVRGGNCARVTYRSARISILITVILSSVLSIPMYLYLDVVEIAPFCGSYCVERWPETSYFVNARVYTLFVAVLQFGAPILATSACYTVIARYLKRRHKALNVDRRQLLLRRRRRGAESDLSTTTSFCTTTNLNDQQQQCGDSQQRIPVRSVDRRLTVRRRRTVRMMASMVAAFAILWTPITLINLVQDFDQHGRLFDVATYRLLFACAHLIAMTTLIWNPIIYAWFNRRIRTALKRFLRNVGCPSDCVRWRRRR